MMPSKKGAIARLRVKRSGRRKCCRVQKPAGVNLLDPFNCSVNSNRTVQDKSKVDPERDAYPQRTSGKASIDPLLGETSLFA